MGGEALMPTWQLYSLVIGQLRDDGFSQVAGMVSSATFSPTDETLPENRLRDLLRKVGDRLTSGKLSTSTKILTILTICGRVSPLQGLQAEREEKQRAEGRFGVGVGVGGTAEVRRVPLASSGRLPGGPPTPDFSSPGVMMGVSRKFPPHDSQHVFHHKASARCARFSPDGRLVATGSADSTIKLMEVDKLCKVKGVESLGVVRPVVRSFFDHTQAINDLDFHPHSGVLVSGAKDNTIKFFDYSEKQSGRKAFRVIQDTHNVRSVCFHPRGDYVIAGTDHTLAHLYDVNTFQCYLSATVQETHLGGVIHQVRYNGSGSMYATCSADGGVRLWDGVNALCVRTMMQAHGGSEATSATFTRDERYLLTCGKDSTVRLWEVASGRPIKTYRGSTHASTKCQAVFTQREDFVMCVDQQTNEIVVWDSVSGEVSARLASHHSCAPRWLEHSPTEAAFVTCGFDKSVRFWMEDNHGSLGE